MFLKICTGLTNIYIRRMSTNVNKNLFNKAHLKEEKEQKRNAQSTFNYLSAVGVLAIGLTYAAVPMYRLFCQAFSYGGTTSHNNTGVAEMKPVKHRVLKIRFNADTASQMAWNFTPLQQEIKLVPGETALAFYTAENPTDVAICGVSTYNVVPFEAGQYFNKIQCFCFEEQMLGPHERVEMPVFFYIDPEFSEDPKMEYINELILSYTFFEAKEGTKLPIPSYIKRLH